VVTLSAFTLFDLYFLKERFFVGSCNVIGLPGPEHYFSIGIKITGYRGAV